jgi:hypothetical protein
MIKTKTHTNLYKPRLNVKKIQNKFLNLIKSQKYARYGYQDISVLNICDISVLGTRHIGTE